MTELFVGVAGVVGVFVVQNFLKGTRKVLFRIWTKALKDTLRELDLEEKGQFEVLYGILENLHKADAKTEDMESVVMDELVKK